MFASGTMNGVRGIARACLRLAACALASSGTALAGLSTEIPQTPGEVQRTEACDRTYKELKQKFAQDARAVRDAFMAEKQRCAGTGFYEYLLGQAERNAGDDAAAAGIFEDAVKRRLPFYEQSFVMMITLRGEAAMKSQPPDVKRLRELRDQLAEFAAGHSPDPFVYQQLAAANISVQDWPAAAEAARKSIQVDRLTGKASRYLMVALHASKRCTEALEDVRPAIESNRELMADANFMLPAADCYAETGDPVNGEAALNALLRKNPAMKDNPGVIELQKYFAVKNRPASPSK